MSSAVAHLFKTWKNTLIHKTLELKEYLLFSHDNKYTNFLVRHNTNACFWKGDLYLNVLVLFLTLQSLMLLTTWLYSLLKVCVRRRRHCKETRSVNGRAGEAAGRSAA